jgi:hypothetical protein
MQKFQVQLNTGQANVVSSLFCGHYVQVVRKHPAADLAIKFKRKLAGKPLLRTELFPEMKKLISV